MAAKQLFLALLFCIVQRSTGQRPNVLEISPQTLQLSPGNSSTGGKVVITCKDSPIKPPATLYVSLGLFRQLPGQSQSSISFLLLNGQAPATGPVGIPGATVKGNATARTLELTIPDATCADSGNYSCKMISAGSDLNPQDSWSYEYFKVEVLPGAITLVPEPSGKSQWVVNETLLIRCNGAVGSVDNSTTIKWVWEYAYNRNGVIGSWSPYENTNDIEVDPMIKVNDCVMQQVSRLTRTMELSDTDRVYRCYITRNGVPYTQFAQTVDVGSVTRGTGQRPNVLEISPQTLQLSPGNSSTGGKVVITCKDSPIKPPATVYVSLGLSRQLPGQWQSSISVLLLNGQAPATGPLGIPGATVKGNATARTLELTIPDATCADSGNYSCRMISLGSDLNPQDSWSYEYFKVEVLPGAITLIPEPSGKSQWVVKETLLIQCNGAVGSVDNSTTIKWVWEYAYNRNGVIGSWSPYENTNDIEVDPMNKVNDCVMQQVSRLTRTMELSDTDRVYRCYITRNGVPYTQFAQTVDVGSVTREPVTTTPGNSGGSDTGEPVTATPGNCGGSDTGGAVEPESSAQESAVDKSPGTEQQTLYPLSPSTSASFLTAICMRGVNAVGTQAILI